jgi:hypothetical protein
MGQAVGGHAVMVEMAGSVPGQSMWSLWWTKWHWDSFFFLLKFFCFALSALFYQCSTFIHSSPTFEVKVK